MTHTDWHLDDATLARYARGATTAAVAASAEAHLTTCAQCRNKLAAALAPDRLDAIWEQVERRVDVADLPLPERVLVRLGIPESTARLLAATPSLTTSWLAAVTAAVVFAVTAASTSATWGMWLFLTVAPMLPVAGVAAAYGRDADPAHELAVASPFSLFRLLLLRAVVVIGSTMAITLLVGLLLADNGRQAAAWLLPALATSTTTLALSARVRPVWAGAGVLAAWVGVVLIAYDRSGDRLAAFDTTGQLLAAILALAAVVALLRQRPAFAYDSRRSA